MYIHLEQDPTVDPRVLRTRELLINSFAKLLIEHKSIRKISVQSVTTLAGVNRVTFYAHFTDKYDLLDTWARLMFQQSVIEQLPSDAAITRQNLTILLNASFNFFTMRDTYRRRINAAFEPMFEAAVQQELQSAIEQMLTRTSPAEQSQSNQHIALFLSWAIFGSLLDKARQTSNKTRESFINEILAFCETLVLQPSS